jgi:hypothetical protein
MLGYAMEHVQALPGKQPEPAELGREVASYGESAIPVAAILTLAGAIASGARKGLRRPGRGQSQR